MFAILWGAFILFATLTSGGTLSRFHLSELFNYDKPIHMFLFGAQSWLIIAGRRKSAYKNDMNIVLYSCIIGMGFGIITELLQGFIVLFGRSFDVMDMIADALGCLVVYVWFWLKHKPFAQ